MEKAARRKKISKIIYIIGMLGVIMLNYLAWRSREFCDWYIDHIFPVWLNTYARLTSALSISGRNYADSGSRDYCVRNRLFYL